VALLIPGRSAIIILRRQSQKIMLIFKIVKPPEKLNEKIILTMAAKDSPVASTSD
jgi:hypothetical protein